MDTARKRILYFINSQKIRPKNFLAKTGLKKGFIDRSHEKSGATDLNLSKILEAYPDISAKWLLTGKGKMLVEEKTEDSPNLEKAHKAQADCQEKVEKLKKELGQKNKLIDYLETDLKKCKEQLFFKGQPVPRDT